MRWMRTKTRRRYFYPRPPGGGRQYARHATLNLVLFLSTPSGWRATEVYVVALEHKKFLSTPSGWRATEVYVVALEHKKFLSTPSGWRATNSIKECTDASIFLSTPSGWRATTALTEEAGKRYISIHALRVEGDRHRCAPPFFILDFYPRPPGGGRPAPPRRVSIPPAISIHALRVEGDFKRRKSK